MMGCPPIAALDAVAASMSNPELPGVGLNISSLGGLDSSDSV